MLMINTFLIPKSVKIWSSRALPIKKTKGNLDGMSRDRPLGDESITILLYLNI